MTGGDKKTPDMKFRSGMRVALQQTLRKTFASTKSAIPTIKETPVIVRGPVIVIKGKQAAGSTPCKLEFCKELPTQVLICSKTEHFYSATRSSIPPSSPRHPRQTHQDRSGSTAKRKMAGSTLPILFIA